jgi:transposase
LDRRIFKAYAEAGLAPALRQGDVAMLDDLPAHKSAAEKVVCANGAWLLFLPPSSPDLNPTGRLEEPRSELR